MPRTDARPALGRLRIIGGNLRGSKLAVPDAPGLRPTPDRLRETLFNWLMPVIEGSRCLDLFAGTGALGIEALSRGAVWTDFVETDPHLAQALRENLLRLKQAQATVYGSDALTLLGSLPKSPYDIVFVDPPFSAGHWDEVAVLLEANAWLRAGALIYLEMPASTQPVVPPAWSLHREATAGAVRCALYRHRNASAKL